VTDQEINRAVAEASGWIPDPKNSGNVFYKYWTKGNQRMVDPCPKHEDTGTPCDIWPTILMPDYCNSYDAIMPLVKALKKGREERFVEKLMDAICPEDSGRHWEVAYKCECHALFTATPRQLCEAYLAVGGADA
jgi:hypothetical protein